MAVCAALLLLASISVASSPRAAAAVAPPCSGGALQVVAHEDDDILFQSPDILRDIDQKRCIRTVFVTAGDGGYDASYWQSLEHGAEAAWADMAGAANQWTRSTISLAGKPVQLSTLDDSPNISLIFMRLPDGLPLGTGSAAYGYQSLYRMLNGSISTVAAVDGSATYTATTLRNALLDAMRASHATVIRTQDYVSNYGDDADHYDHHAVAFLTRDAASAYNSDHVLKSYLGYGNLTLDNAYWRQNVFGNDLDRKTSAFAAYVKYDDEIDWDAYWNTGWLQRQYVISTDGKAVAADAGTDQNAGVNSHITLDGTGSSGVNALSYTWKQTTGPSVTLSNSTAAKPTFTPTQAGTYTFDLTVSDGNASSTDSVTVTVGSTFPSSVPTVTPSTPSSTTTPSTAPSGTTNLARTATVTQSSQASGQEGTKAIDGIAKGYPESATNEWATTGQGTGAWITLTWNTPVTLSKIVLYDRPNTNDQITGATLTFSDGTTVPVTSLANDGTATTITFPTRTVTNVQLKITSVKSTTENIGLAEFEAWGTTDTTTTPTVTPSTPAPTTTTPSATPTPTPSTSPSPTPSTPSSTTTPSTAPSGTTNLARTATVTQSSQASGQEGTKAIDGIAKGYPESATNEWATTGQGTGAWITLTWNTPVTLSKIVLYDRPNTNDQITGATLTFSDGTTVPITALDNNGAATTFTFPARTVTNVQLKITSVKPTTENIGLAEFEAWGTTDTTTTGPTPSATPTPSTTPTPTPSTTSPSPTPSTSTSPTTSATTPSATMTPSTSAPTVAPSIPGTAPSTTASVAHGSLRWGAFLPTDGSAGSSYQDLVGLTGAHPDYVMVFASLTDSVPLSQLREIVGNGAIPIVALEPWNPAGGVDQPEFATSRIADGAYDSDLSRWADALHGLNTTVILRYAHEMNGDWYPWAIGVNGNTGSSYISAWRHVHQVFGNSGASNVKFMWSPNVPFSSSSSNFSSYYPGPDYVDILGINGYNWGTGGGFNWIKPDDLFNDGLNQLRGLSGNQPILISETASAEGSGPGESKAQWISQFMNYLSSQNRVTGFIWFDMNKERDWRINSSPESAQAFREGLSEVAATHPS